MDHTSTQFGKRMLRRWITSPSLEVDVINERLDAVQDLMKNIEITEYFQDRLSQLPDLERMVGKIYNLSNKKRMSAVYFEDFAKNRLKDFMKFLNELKTVEEIVDSFNDYIPAFKSKKLIQLTSFKDVDIEAFKVKKKGKKKNNEGKDGIFPRINHIIEDLEKMVEVKHDLPIPAPGVNSNIDRIMEKMEVIKVNLNKILEQYRKQFKSKDIQFVNSKEKYELEVPEYLVQGSQRPKEFILTSKRAGFLRFRTQEIGELVIQLWVLECEFQRCLVDFIVSYFKEFYKRHSYWNQVISCLAELDCLCSQARLAKSMRIKCRPQVLPPTKDITFELRNMVHPCVAISNPDFVPNDIVYENEQEIFLITGPNMGGKSTLLRQAGIAVIMAQSGSFLPADSFNLSIVDRIFTRLGANDRILEGKSTFFVEMEETYNIVEEATRNSLLIIDELGRGTSTYDGVSIAYSTLKYITSKIKCLTLFSTHYHLLVEEFKLYPSIGNYYMESIFDDQNDEIQFLYKFSKGETLKSHGTVIAKVAGLPEDVLKVARSKAKFLTREKKNIILENQFMEKFNQVFDVLQEQDNSNGKQGKIEPESQEQDVNGDVSIGKIE